MLFFFSFLLTWLCNKQSLNGRLKGYSNKERKKKGVLSIICKRVILTVTCVNDQVIMLSCLYEFLGSTVEQNTDAMITQLLLLSAQEREQERQEKLQRAQEEEQELLAAMQRQQRDLQRHDVLGWWKVYLPFVAVKLTNS